MTAARRRGEAGRIGLVAAAALIAGAPTLSASYFDLPTVVKYLLPLARGSPALARQILLPANEMKFLRPLWGLSIAFDYRLWGLDALGYHLTHLAAHVGTAVLVYGLVRRRLSAPLGLVAGLLFAVHPASAATIAVIDQRGDVLTAPLLAAAFLVATSPGRRWWTRLGPALFGLALLVKETALALPLVIGAAAALEPGPVRQRAAAAGRQTAPYAAVALVYLAVRWLVLGGMGGYRDGQAHFEFGVDTLRSLGDLLGTAAGADPFVPPPGWLAWPAAAVLALALLSARRRPQAALGAIWFLACLLPPLTIRRFLLLHLGGTARFVYPALPGALLALAGLAQTTSPARAPGAAAAAAPGRKRLATLGLAALAVAGVLGSWRVAGRLHRTAEAHDSAVARKLLNAFPELPPATSVYVIAPPAAEPFQRNWTPERRRLQGERRPLLDRPLDLVEELLRAAYPEAGRQIHRLAGRDSLPALLPEPSLVVEWQPDGSLVRLAGPAPAAAGPAPGGAAGRP